MHPQGRSGFTLLEAIMVMVIIGILAIFGGAGFRQMIQGYVQSSEAMSSSLKLTNSMARLHRELQQLTDVTEVNPAYILYSRGDEDYGIGFVDGAVKLDTNGEVPTTVRGSVLLGNVSAFALEFLDADGNDWTAARPLDELYRINISLTLDIGNGATVQTVVNPLYNRTLNGPV